MNIELYLSLRELVLSNPAFLFSFLIYLRLWEVFWLNQRKIIRYKQVYLLMTVCFMYFNTALQGVGSSYRMMFVSDSTTVKDASDADITGTISSGSISFTFDYDNDTLGGTAGTDKAVKLVGIRPGSGKYAIATGLLQKSKALSFSLVGEADRAYSAA